jgi:hypothetical protein
MRTRLKIWLMVILAVTVTLGLLVAYNRSEMAVRAAPEEPYDLWLAVIKGFSGPVNYMGSDGGFAYFRAGSFFYDHYKTRASNVLLPRVFPIGGESLTT